MGDSNQDFTTSALAIHGDVQSVSKIQGLVLNALNCGEKKGSANGPHNGKCSGKTGDPLKPRGLSNQGSLRATETDAYMCVAPKERALSLVILFCLGSSPFYQHKPFFSPTS